MIDSLSMQWTKLLDFLWNSITNIDSSYRMIMKIYHNVGSLVYFSEPLDPC